MSDFNLKKFREEFLQSDGWQVSDCYKPYDDKFLRRDAQDAYEGAKWAWNERQKELDLINEYTYAQGESIKILNDERMLQQKKIDAVLNFVRSTTNENVSLEACEFICELLKGANND